MKLVLDIETQNSFKDIGGKANLSLLKISLVGAYWYPENKFLTFMEQELAGLEEFIAGDELHDQIRVGGIFVDRDNARHMRTA